jgi:hypothetical protein
MDKRDRVDGSQRTARHSYKSDTRTNPFDQRDTHVESTNNLKLLNRKDEVSLVLQSAARQPVGSPRVLQDMPYARSTPILLFLVVGLRIDVMVM